jgi:hypothetical protein
MELMMRPLIRATILALALPFAGAAQTQTNAPERFSAFAISLGGATTRSGTAHFEIEIARWSDADELGMLLDALDDGQESLVAAMRDRKPVGFIRTSDSLAYDLRFAQQDVGADGTRRIFLATDRPIRYRELVNRPPTLGYPVTVVELTLDKNGEGEGKLSVATRLTASGDRERLYVQNYDVQPVLLKGVKRRD